MIQYQIHVWNNNTVPSSSNSGLAGESTDSQVTWYDILMYTHMTLDSHAANSATKKDTVCGALVHDLMKVFNA